MKNLFIAASAFGWLLLSGVLIVHLFSKPPEMHHVYVSIPVNSDGYWSVPVGAYYCEFPHDKQSMTCEVRETQ